MHTERSALTILSRNEGVDLVENKKIEKEYGLETSYVPGKGLQTFQTETTVITDKGYISLPHTAFEGSAKLLDGTEMKITLKFPGPYQIKHSHQRYDLEGDIEVLVNNKKPVFFKYGLISTTQTNSSVTRRTANEIALYQGWWKSLTGALPRQIAVRQALFLISAAAAFQSASQLRHMWVDYFSMLIGRQSLLLVAFLLALLVLPLVAFVAYRASLASAKRSVRDLVNQAETLLNAKSPSDVSAKVDRWGTVTAWFPYIAAIAATCIAIHAAPVSRMIDRLLATRSMFLDLKSKAVLPQTGDISIGKWSRDKMQTLTVSASRAPMIFSISIPAQHDGSGPDLYFDWNNSPGCLASSSMFFADSGRRAIAAVAEQGATCIFKTFSPKTIDGQFHVMSVEALKSYRQ